MNDIERYLYKYTDAQKQLDKLLDKLKQAIQTKDDAYIPPNMAVDPTKARVQKSDIESPVERAVVMIVDEYWKDIENIQHKMIHYRTIINNIDNMMLALTPDQRECIQYRYFDDKSRDATADLMHVSSRTASRLSNSALETLQGQYKAICGADKQTYQCDT